MIRVHQGHVLDVLAGMDPGSVQCCVTSPPYWGLRTYPECEVVWSGDAECEHVWGADVPGDPRGGSGPNAKEAYAGDGKTTYARQVPRGRFCQRCGAWFGELGLEPTIDLYVEHMVAVMRGVWRVLRDDGCCWVNIGDSYASVSGGHTSTETLGSPGLVRNRETERGARRSGLKPKDLCMIPARLALVLQADGWWVRSQIIWAKGVSFCSTHAGSVMPESVTDRPVSAYEMVYLLTKSGTPQYWTHRDCNGTRTQPAPDYRWVSAVSGDEVLEAPADWHTMIPCPDCGGTGQVVVEKGGALMAVEVKEPCERCKDSEDHKVPAWTRVNLWAGRDYYYDAEAVREAGSFPAGTRAACGSQVRARQPGVNARPNEYAIYSGMRHLRNVWVINPQASKLKHYASFPERLVEPCVKAGSSPRACGVCGAPWERVLEKKFYGSYHSHSADGVQYGRRQDDGGVPPQTGYVPPRTTGWRPTCSHADDPGTAQSVVLDPFAGTCTTGVVCKRLGRAFVGIELSPGYVEMARKRLAQPQTREMFE